MADISIGELARRSGVKVPTIRYYDQAGLLPIPARTPRATSAAMAVRPWGGSTSSVTPARWVSRCRCAPIAGAQRAALPSLRRGGQHRPSPRRGH